MTKAILVLAIVGLVLGILLNTGWVNVGDAVALYVVLPAGAIFLGLFLIIKILEKESAAYDQEHHRSGSHAQDKDNR